MIGAEQAIAAGYAAFKARDYAAARGRLTGIDHPQAIHLLGLVEKGAGNYELAFKYLAKAAELDPQSHEIANNRGLLARMTGDLPIAEAAFRLALKLKPDFRSARLSLGRTLNGLGQHQEAMTELSPLITQSDADVTARIAYATAALDMQDWPNARTQIEAALAQEPEYNGARYASGVLALHTGDVSRAKTIFSELLDEGQIAEKASFMMARVALMDGDLPAARTHAETAYTAERTSENLLFLADLYWTSGDRKAFEALIEEALEDTNLALAAIGLIRKSGLEAEALEALGRQSQAVRETFAGESLKSAILLDLSKPDEALIAARAAAQKSVRVQDNYDLARALISNGQAAEALELIQAARKDDPQSQFWLGYEATALRLLGDARYGELVDYNKHVRVYELPVPPGFAKMEDFNAEFLFALDNLNPFSIHPLNQSLRNGGQAPNNLCVSENPTIRAYFEALDAPIRDYMQVLGNSPDHPSAERNTGRYKFSGSWSVRLGGGGHHVNHVHPRGWISSSYYVSVPSETLQGESKAGWIKFGEPPIDARPVLKPEKWVQPKAGMLVLFPSFLWHGTEPIHDGSVRVTAPFDVVPD